MEARRASAEIVKQAIFKAWRELTPGSARRMDMRTHRAATVPPTIMPASRHFAPRAGPVAFGWAMVAHQLEAAFATYGAGVFRSQTGSYAAAFVIARAFGLLAALARVSMARGRNGPRAAAV